MNYDKRDPVSIMADKIAGQAADDGRLIDVGWLTARNLFWPDSVGPASNVLRFAFFLGALHLFGSVGAVLDEEREPTEADERRMAAIAGELDAFGEEVRERLEAVKKARQ